MRHAAINGNWHATRTKEHFQALTRDADKRRGFIVIYLIQKIGGRESGERGHEQA